MPIRTQLQDEQQERQRKSLILTIIISIPFAILILRLFWLQVVEADKNIRLSLENQMRQVVLKAPRGRIFDRNGQVLAQNRLSYSICVLPYQLKRKHDIITPLLKIRDINGDPAFDSTDLVNTIRKAQYRRFDYTRLKEDVPIDIVSIIEEHAAELPGIVVETEARREYTLGSASFHVLGYMSEIPEAHFDSLKKDGYHYGDMIGKAGVEKQYEKLFKGKDGTEYIEVNAFGKCLGVIADMPRTEPVSGEDIFLSLDAGLQKVACDSFPDSLKGAVVAINPSNGEVLAMYSNPSVDPNIFSQSIAQRSKKWSAIATDPNLPLNNRVTSGTYTPGSTFKLVSAVAGLEADGFNHSTTMPASCGGAYRIGSRVAHCWELRGHGRLNLVDAVKKSCNIYFYQVGLRVGDQVINQYAQKFGLGLPTGIDLPSEKAGWLSGEEAYNKRYKNRRGWVWTKGLVLDLAIGQQQVLTPLQLAVMTGGMGNAVATYRPTLLKETHNLKGEVTYKTQPVVSHQLNLKPETITTIHNAMLEVLRPGGTAGRAVVKGIPVGGKTGSAENPHGDKTHGLFVGCAPVDSPVIAIAVVVENAGHGGSVAAPIAGAVLRYFFSQTIDGRKVAAKYGVTYDPPKQAQKDSVKNIDSTGAVSGTANNGHKPSVNNVTAKPMTSGTTVKPTAPNTPKKPATTIATPKPKISSGTKKPVTSPAASKPAGSDADTKPATAESTLKPAASGDVASKPAATESAAPAAPDAAAAEAGE